MTTVIASIDGVVVQESSAEEAAIYAQTTADHNAQEAKLSASRQRKQDQFSGVLFEGVMCSATSEDMWGLGTIRHWIVAGNSTNFEFSNGNILTITPSNLDAFEAVWIPFRASFFP